MPKISKPTADSENPEWSAEKFARAKRFDELPAGVQSALKSRGRGPQKAPTKKLVSVRLSPDVLAAVRATGHGWQSRIDEALRTQFVKERPAPVKRARRKVA
ncbi:MAG TPA: BrnA antitoxin family protein [Acidobacteriaceae bacterium]|nr:BrnA antitoxin family protein [Acidobacteriaceae bacterium]